MLGLLTQSGQHNSMLESPSTTAGTAWHSLPLLTTSNDFQKTLFSPFWRASRKLALVRLRGEQGLGLGASEGAFGCFHRFGFQLSGVGPRGYRPSCKVQHSRRLEGSTASLQEAVWAKEAAVQSFRKRKHDDVPRTLPFKGLRLRRLSCPQLRYSLAGTQALCTLMHDLNSHVSPGCAR